MCFGNSFESFGQQAWDGNRLGMKILKIRRGGGFYLQILANFNMYFDTSFESFGQQVRAA